MAKTLSDTKKGSSKKVGRAKDKCSNYRSRGILLKNKIKRITKSNGLTAVLSYKKDKTKPFPKENKV